MEIPKVLQSYGSSLKHNLFGPLTGTVMACFQTMKLWTFSLAFEMQYMSKKRVSWRDFKMKPRNCEVAP